MRPRQLSMQLGYTGARGFDPVTRAQEGARDYAAGTGRGYDPTVGQEAMVDHHRGWRQFLAHKDALASGPTPEVMASYGALRNEVNSQFEHMTKPQEQGGMGMQFESVDHDPYSSPHEMAADVAQGRIKVMGTRVTGSHAFFTDDENDRFRAVHDVFGHAAIGRTFSRHGEEGAYQAHAQMFSPEARIALASETRGQNSFLNYGGGEFPPNQPVHLPDWATDNREVPGMTRQQLGIAGNRFSRKQHFEQQALL